MQVGVEGDILVVRLEQDEDVLGSLEKVAAERGITSGHLLSGIGMLHDFEIGYFNGKDYLKRHVTEPHELTSMQGSIASKEGKPNFHIHVTLAGSDHNIVGGHLFKGKVNIINEIVIRKFKHLDMRRELNNATGLWELNV